MGTYKICLEREKQSNSNPCPLTHTHSRHFSHFSSILGMYLLFISLDLGIEDNKYALLMGSYIRWLLIIYTQVHILFSLSYQKTVSWENRMLTGHLNDGKEGETRGNEAFWTIRGNEVADRSKEGTNDELDWLQRKIKNLLLNVVEDWLN